MKLENLQKAHDLNAQLSKINNAIYDVENRYEVVALYKNKCEPSLNSGVATKNSSVQLTDKFSETILNYVKTMMLEDLHRQKQEIIRQVESLD